MALLFLKIRKGIWFYFIQRIQTILDMNLFISPFMKNPMIPRFISANKNLYIFIKREKA